MKDAVRWRGPAVVLAGCLAVRGALFATGTRFSLRFPSGQTAWQLLDLDTLHDRPQASLWDLHTQPPLFNLFTGLVVRLSPFPDRVSFQVVYLALGLVGALTLYAILTRLGCRWWVAAPVTVVVFSDPNLIQYENQLTYEVPIAVLLLGCVWACLRYAETPTVRRFAAFVGLATALVLTRALFHPLWLALGIGLVLALRRPVATDWRRVAVVAALPFVLILGLMTKNQVRFGTFSLSSWFGMNLDRMVVNSLPGDERDELIADGTLSDQATVEPFAPYDDYEPYAAADCRADYGGAALDDPWKTGEPAPNYNYGCYLPVYEQAQHDAVAVIRNRPGHYVVMVRAAFVTYLSEEGLSAVEPSKPVTMLDRLHDTLGLETTVTAWYGEMPLPLRVYPTALLSLVGLLGAAAWAGWRSFRGRGSVADVVVVFVGFTVAYATAAGVLFELWENARFRLPLDPILFAAPLALAAELLARRFADRPEATAVLSPDPHA